MPLTRKLAAEFIGTFGWSSGQRERLSHPAKGFLPYWVVQILGGIVAAGNPGIHRFQPAGAARGQFIARLVQRFAP